MQLSTISGEIFEGILEQLREHNNLTEQIVGQLASIADSLPIPFVPVVPVPEERYRREQQFHKALELVRNALDEGKPAIGAGVVVLHDQLFQIEALLAAELGEPVWKSHDPRDRRREAVPDGAPNVRRS